MVGKERLWRIDIRREASNGCTERELAALEAFRYERTRSPMGLIIKEMIRDRQRKIEV